MGNDGAPATVGAVATINETIWVHNDAEMQTTVQTLIGQGGTVVNQTEGAITVQVQKKLNVPLLIVLFVLGCLPGVVYLLWHVAANANQVVTVQVGQPSNIGGYHPENAVAPGPTPPAVGAAPVQDAVVPPPPPLPAGGSDPWMVPPPATPGAVQDAVNPGYGTPPPAPPAPPTGF